MVELRLDKWKILDDFRSSKLRLSDSITRCHLSFLGFLITGDSPYDFGKLPLKMPFLSVNFQIIMDIGMKTWRKKTWINHDYQGFISMDKSKAFFPRRNSMPGDHRDPQRDDREMILNAY